ncbi:hypothetical protein [Bifidobacterium bifidum]|uniref:phage tail tube protein n=1 Tax=Bifidobacterium bifidum TaxID=1681 RepID=UPI003D0168D0
MGKPNAQMVSVGKPHGSEGRYAGGAWYGNVGEATPPTDAVTPLGDAFHDLGYLSEDGVTKSAERDSEDITAFGGDRVLSVTTSLAESFQFGMIETTKETLSVTYGPGNVTVKTVDSKEQITVKHNGLEPPELVYVFEFAMTGDRIKRIVVPLGKTGDMDDVTYAGGEAITYTSTINAFPDSQGNNAYEYIAYVTTATPARAPMKAKAATAETVYDDATVPTLAKAAAKATTKRRTTKTAA